MNADDLDALINDTSASALAWYSVVSGNPISPTAAAIATGSPLPVAVALPTPTIAATVTSSPLATIAIVGALVLVVVLLLRK